MLEDNKHRKLNNNIFVNDLGYRKDEPIALLEKIKPDGRKEMIIAFNYEIKDNNISWGYGYYYYGDFEKAKADFNKVLNGGNLANTFNKEKNKNSGLER